MSLHPRLRVAGAADQWARGRRRAAAPLVAVLLLLGALVGIAPAAAAAATGTVVGWGWNYAGQASPPAGLTGVTAIAAGNFHSLALQGGAG